MSTSTPDGFAYELELAVAKQIAIAMDPRNLVDEAAGETLVGDPIVDTKGRQLANLDTNEPMWNIRPRGGWIPTAEKTIGRLHPTAETFLIDAPPETWEETDELQPHLRIKAHQEGWDTPVSMTFYRSRIQGGHVLRFLVIAIDLAGSFTPGQVAGMEEMLQAMAGELSQPYFEGAHEARGWAMHVGSPVPVVLQGGAGNVTFRTPVMCRVVAADDPNDNIIAESAQAPRPTITEG